MMQCWSHMHDGRLERIIEITRDGSGHLFLDNVPVQLVLHWADDITTLVTSVDATHLRTTDYMTIAVYGIALVSERQIPG